MPDAAVQRMPQMSEALRFELCGAGRTGDAAPLDGVEPTQAEQDAAARAPGNPT